MREKQTSNGTSYYLKTGAQVEGTEAQNEILEAASEVYEDTDQRLVVTSGDEGDEGDGIHMEGSLHYEGKALDFRIWNLGDPQATADALAERLGEDFDVVYGEGHDTHIHVEKDPSC